MKKLFKRIYLDYAATTPVDPRVVKAMQPFWSERFANPSALYKSGLDAHTAVAESRAAIAQILNAKPSEIIFTAGGTESNNLAILGMAQAYQKQHGKPGHIITTPIEHHSVLHVVEALKNWGWQISYAPVDSEGFINLEDLKKLAKKDTALVSVMYANNEIGTIEPIAEVGKWLTGLNKARFAKGLGRILFHTDACQAAGTLSLDVQELKIDLLTLNGSKIYGPKQTGILFVRTGVKLEPIIHGGGQERDLRSGTENVPGVVGLASALSLVVKDQKKENARLITLRNYLDDRLSKKVKGIKTNGPALSSKKDSKRLPNNLNFTIDKVEGEALMLYLDAAGIEVSTGSACTTTSEDPSHVLVAIGISKAQAYNSIRLTLGKQTTKAELDRVIGILPGLTEQLRRTVSEV
ncbi:MAG TPA: cysteine desulfurase family protein [Patescibacteria group bacterium]|jgi:cysteine desulfurase|nr:cysteine desulfurase family protein [Patescibacteria group bacterium]